MHPGSAADQEGSHAHSRCQAHPPSSGLFHPLGCGQISFGLYKIGGRAFWKVAPSLKERMGLHRIGGREGIPKTSMGFNVSNFLFLE